jgi:hypothetical protein
VRDNWTLQICDAEWSLYREAMRLVREKGVDFMLGGGFAQAVFTGRWRSTKDIDLYLLPEQRQLAIAALTEAGFSDYYNKLAYDRRWIYRTTKDGFIVDLIWSMANRRACVQPDWFEYVPVVEVREEKLKVLPMEEFMWCKLYILQRDRCDWIDIMNLLYSNGPKLDWDRLLRRLGDDWPLLKALLCVYGWLSPERASLLPGSLRERMGLSEPQAAAGWRERVGLLDSRAWFAALKPRGEKLEI